VAAVTTRPASTEIDEAPPGQEALAPVDFVEGETLRQPNEGIALCLSGGGSRAMLFHAGALIRLNELGLLNEIDLISSVSGGSIIAGVLARYWADLDFDDHGCALNFEDLVVKPLRDICRHRIDKPAWVIGFFTPWLTPIKRFAQVLDDHLFGGVKLSAVAQKPEFVINATNLASTVLWRFSQEYMRDYRVGEISPHDTTIATAVAASSASRWRSRRCGSTSQQARSNPSPILAWTATTAAPCPSAMAGSTTTWGSRRRGSGTEPYS
jgi:NTE family protein